MTTELFLKIVMALITIMSALVTAYVIPYIKTKISAEELENISYFVTVAVRCAEQIYTAEQWQEKKEYVMDYVRNVMDEHFKIKLSYDQLNAIVEGIVNEIKHGDDK